METIAVPEDFDGIWLCSHVQKPSIIEKFIVQTQSKYYPYNTEQVDLFFSQLPVFIISLKSHQNKPYLVRFVIQFVVYLYILMWHGNC